MSLSDVFKKQLSLFIDREWPKLKYQHSVLVKEQSPNKYPGYKEVRDTYFAFTGIATLIDSEIRNEILDGWSNLQEFMIGYVREGLKSKKSDTSEELEYERGHVRDLESIDSKVKAGMAELQKLVLDPNKIAEIANKSAELQREKQKLNDLHVHRKNVSRLEAVLSSFESLFDQCEQVTEMTPLGRINYLILGPEEILQGIQEGTFKGFPYEPFEVTPGSALSTESIKAVVEVVSRTSNTARQNLPVQLRNVLEIKDVVDAYKSGSRIKSDDVKEQLRQDHPYSARMVGGYLRNNEDLFGVQWMNDTAPPYFKKTKDDRLTDENFLSRLKLDPIERRTMDKAMIKAVLDEMHTKGEYDTFESELIHKRLQEKGYNGISLKGVGINLGKSGEDLGVRRLGKDGWTTHYELADVVVTDDHRSALNKAFESFGYAEFSEEDWRLRACNNMFIHPRVMKELVKDLPSAIERLEMDGKTRYRSKDRPKTAEEQLAEVKSDADMDDPF